MKKAIFLFDVTGFMALPWAEAGYQCFCFDGQHPAGVSVSKLHHNIINVGMWFSNDVTGDVSMLNDVDNIRVFTGDDVNFVFGFPECTHLAVSGAAHFASKRCDNPFFQDEAMVLVKLTRLVGNSYGCPWALENPVSVISTMWRKPDFKFHPYEYGDYLPPGDKHPMYPEYIASRDAYPKKTCIWAGNGFVMPDKKPVGPGGLKLYDDGKPRFNPKRLGYDSEGYPVWGYSKQHKKLGGKSLKTKNIRSATPRGFAKAVFLANHAEVKIND